MSTVQTFVRFVREAAHKGHLGSVEFQTPAGIFRMGVFENTSASGYAYGDKHYVLRFPFQVDNNGWRRDRGHIPQEISDQVLATFFARKDSDFVLRLESVEFIDYKGDTKVKGMMNIKTNCGEFRGIKYGISDGRVFVMNPSFWDAKEKKNLDAGIDLDYNLRLALIEEAAEKMGIRASAVPQETQEGECVHA